MGAAIMGRGCAIMNESPHDVVLRPIPCIHGAPCGAWTPENGEMTLPRTSDPMTVDGLGCRAKKNPGQDHRSRRRKQLV